jgi:phosphopantothenoylcysteine synthetase/decarboxylase
VTHLVLIACGAPLATRVPDIATAAVLKGWTVAVIATHAAAPWLDSEAIVTACGSAPQLEYRSPGEPKRGQRADVVAVCPATFNTVNKAAYGLADNYAMGVLCEAIGVRVPLVMFPMVNDRLWGHAALAASFAMLRQSGVRLFDPATGRLGERPVCSGTGDEVTRRFDPTWVIAALS